MRRIVAGLDQEGASTVVADGDPPSAFFVPVLPDRVTVESARAATRQVPALTEVAEGEFSMAMLWDVHEQATATEDKTPEYTALTNEPHLNGWFFRYWRLGPNISIPDMHQTPTLDILCITAGSIDLLLQDGSSTTASGGDVIVIPAVMHAWRTGADGCEYYHFMYSLGDHDPDRADERG